MDKKNWIKNKLDSNSLKEQFKNDKINFIRPIILSESLISNDKHCSIVCKLKEDKEVLDNSYYGIHPRVTENFIKKLIKDNIILNEDLFEKYIIDNSKDFHLENKFKDKEIIFHKKTILNSASRFGYKVKTNENKDYFIKLGLKENIDFILKDNLLILLGSITNKQLKLLNNHIIQDCCLVKHDKGIIDLSKEEISTVNDNEYYNGVLAKLINIEEKEEDQIKKLKKYTLTIHKTTFFTVDAFENTTVHEHPYLKQYQDEINKLYNEEINRRKKYLENISYNNFDNINKYLEETYNTNNIAVSSNIITSDNKLILCQRNKSVIDGGDIYCSANGQAEFYDKNVDLYNESSYEDAPSFIYSNEYRLDFNTELTREVVAELGVSTVFKWEYLGLSVLGRIPDNNKELMRLHFNVLATTKIDVISDSIFESRKTALESFENNDIYAFEYYNFSLIKFIKKNVIRITNIISNYQTLFEIIFYVVILGWILKISSYTIDVKTIFTIILFVLIFIYKIIKYFIDKKSKHKNKFYICIKKHNYNQMLLNTKNKISKKKVHIHPIAYIMLILNVNKIK